MRRSSGKARPESEVAFLATQAVDGISITVRVDGIAITVHLLGTHHPSDRTPATRIHRIKGVRLPLPARSPQAVVVRRLRRSRGGLLASPASRRRPATERSDTRLWEFIAPAPPSAGQVGMVVVCSLFRFIMDSATYGIICLSESLQLAL